MTRNYWYNIDWFTVLIYALLVTFGWVNIFAAEYDVVNYQSAFDFSKSYGRQMMFIGVSIVLAIIALLVDARFYSTFSNYIFGATILLLILTLLIGRPVNGATSWIQIGSFSLQPSEFAKTGTILALAKYLDKHGVSIKDFNSKLICAGIILIPVSLVILQNDFGSAMVFFALILMLYREGLHWVFLAIPAWFGILFISSLLAQAIVVMITIAVVALIFIYLVRGNLRLALLAVAVALISGAFSYGVDYAFDNILKEHHRKRIQVLLGQIDDPSGAGYNVHQSLIAIGSGGLDGKGFLLGTQTTGGFVPEQTTDFIFCTVGEEFGLIGTFGVVLTFAVLLFRLVVLAERQRSTFARVYAYGVVSVLFFHAFVNIAMTLGLFPVIGIPLPFFSYGGSSLMGFTVLIFVLLKLDASLKHDFD